MKVVTFETTDGKVRYLLVDAGGVPIEEVRQFLKFEDNRGMARNTLKQKCIHLKHFYTFLQQRRIRYKDVTVDDLAAYCCLLPDLHYTMTAVYQHSLHFPHKP